MLNPGREQFGVFKEGPRAGLNQQVTETIGDVGGARILQGLGCGKGLGLYSDSCGSNCRVLSRESPNLTYV